MKHYTAEDILDAWGHCYPWFTDITASDSYDALTVDFHDDEAEPGEMVAGVQQGPRVVMGSDIRQAVADIIDGRVQVSPSIREYIRRDDLDADAADVIVQVAIFGQIVYA
jgi:hypothetical protein